MLAARFLELWQDQLTAMASDPDNAEGIVRFYRFFADAALPVVPGADHSNDVPRKEGKDAATDPAAWLTAAAPSSGSTDVRLDELAKRLADIEKRLGAWRQNLAPVIKALRKNLADVNSKAFREAVDAVALRQHADMLAGVLRYRHHAYRRTLTLPPVVRRSGVARLFDYGTHATARENGVSVLFVPSLINRSYVLDLSERTSMLCYLAGHGVWPFLLDWGTPGEKERRFTLTNYITGPLEGAFQAVRSLVGAQVVIAGYCRVACWLLRLHSVS